MDSTGFVSEYPLPPMYYKDFDGSESDMKPPSLEHVEDANLRNMSFGSAVQLPNIKYDNIINYKGQMQRYLELFFVLLVDIQ